MIIKTGHKYVAILPRLLNGGDVEGFVSKMEKDLKITIIQVYQFAGAQMQLIEWEQSSVPDTFF